MMMNPILPTPLTFEPCQLPIKDVSTVFQGRKFSKIDAYFADNTMGHLLASIQGVNFGKVEEALEEKQERERELILTPNAFDIVLYGEEPSLERSKIIQETGDLKLVSQNGTVWSKKGRIYAPNKKVIIDAKELKLEDFEIIAKEVEIHGELAQFTNVRIRTQGVQTFNIDEGKFQEVFFDAQKGQLNLSLQEVGIFSSCILLAESDSIICTSEGTLKFKNAQSLAKKEIHNEAADIVNKGSGFAAEGIIHQFAHSEIYSSNTSMETESAIILDGETINTKGLTALGGTGVIAASVKEGRFVASRLYSEEKVALTSKSCYVDMSRSEIDTKHLKAEAEQIMLPGAKVHMEEKAEFISREQQIEAQGTEISSPKNSNSKLSFQAKQGIIYLDHNQTQQVGRVDIVGKYVLLGNSNIRSLRDADIQGKLIEGQDAILTSEEGNITTKGEESLQLDNVYTRALKGQITKESQHWLSEKNNENEALQVKRAAEEMDLVNTKDTASRVHLEASKRFNASRYATEASEAFTLEGKGIASIDGASIETRQIALQADALWSSRTHFKFDQFLAQSRSLSMHSNLVKGNTNTFETLEGATAFYNNQFKTRLNQMKSQGTLSVIQNEMEGKHEINAKRDLLVSHNTFSRGSLEAKSAEGNFFLQNSVLKEMSSVDGQAPYGTATFHRVYAQSDDMTLQANQAVILDSSLESNLLVEGKSALISQTSVDGENVNVNGGDQASIYHTVMKGRQSAALNGGLIELNGSTMQSTEGNASVSSETAHIEYSTVQGKDTNVQADQSLSANQSNFIAVHKTTVESKEQHLNQVTVAGTHTVQEALHIANFETTFSAEQSLQRKADGTLLVQGGKDEAKTMTEKAQSATIIEHTSHAEESHHMEYQQASLVKNTMEGDKIAIKVGIIEGSGNRFNAHKLKLKSESNINMPKTEVNASFGVKSKGKVALTLGHLNGDVNVKGESADFSHTDVEGSFTAKMEEDFDGANLKVKGKIFGVEANSIWTPNVEVTNAKKIVVNAEKQADVSGGELKGEKIGLSAEDLYAGRLKAEAEGDFVAQAQNIADLREAKINADAAYTRANHLWLDRSEVTAGSITGVAQSSLSAQESTQKATENIHFQTSGFANFEHAHFTSETLTAIAENMHAPHLKANVDKEAALQADHNLNLERSHLEAGTIYLQANDSIDHRHATNQSEKNVITTSFFDNREGTIRGDIQAKTTRFDNSHGHLHLGENVSFIETEHLFNDHQSTISGNGSIGIQTRYSHLEQSDVNIKGTYQLTSDGAILDSTIKANGVIVDAAKKDMNITPKGNVESESATFRGGRFSNEGKGRFKILEIDQTHFGPIGDAIATEHLIHRVDSSIFIDGMKTPGSLTLVSRQGEVDVRSLDIGNDLTLQGQRRLHLTKNVHAAGRGILLTPGMCHFDHATNISFKNGIDADVGTFYSQASNIDVVGRSSLNSIQCHDFRLEGEMEIPLYRAHPSQRYAYKPSNFHLDGDLYLKVKNKAENIGSNLLVDGDGFLDIKSYDNLNVQHEYTRIVEAGKYKTKKKHKKKWKTLHKSEHHIVVDAYANTQFSGTARVNIGPMKNTGVFLAHNILGEIGPFDNGLQSNQGQIAPLQPGSIPLLKGLPTPRAVGDFQATESIQLEIDRINNTGFIEGGDKVGLKIKGLFHNRKRLAEEQEEAILKKRRGKTKVHHVTVDHIQLGGEIKGRIVEIEAPEGKNQGLIQGRDDVKGSGGSFDNEALMIRSVNPFNHRAKISFHGAEYLSGGSIDLDFTDRFKNEASDVMAWNGLNLTAGEVVERPRFATNVEQDKKGSKKRTLQRSIEMKEGRIWSVKKPLNLRTTRGDVDIVGELGSLESHLKVDSARDILFGACTESVENRVSGWKASFGKVNWQQIKYNTTKTSLPHAFAGDGAEFNGRNFGAEGLQLGVIGDAEGKFERSEFKSHKVEHYVKTKGLGIGVQAFGVPAIQAALDHQKRSRVVKTLLSEDPALNSVFKLAASRDGVDWVKNGIGSVVKVWNEAAHFARAYNQGNLGNALGEHFGITDGDGNLFPRVSVYADLTSNEKKWTTSAPSMADIRGNLKWHAEEQINQGAEYEVSESAELKGHTFVGEADSDTFSTKSKGMKPSVSFGPSGLGVGLDYREGSSQQRTYSNFKFNAGRKLNMQFDRSTRFSGAEVEANEIFIKTPHLTEESKQNTFSQKGFHVGASTQGSFSFGIENASSAQVKRVSFIKARKQGVIDADYMKLVGASTQNIHINTKKFEAQDLKDVNKGSSFSVDFALPRKRDTGHSQEAQKPEGLFGEALLEEQKPQGINLFGEVDCKSHHKEVNIKPVVSGGNGQALGVETNLDKQREVIKDKRMHLGAPIVTVNSNALMEEVQEVRKAFNLDSAPQPVVSAPEEIKSPEKAKKEKKSPPEVKAKKHKKEVTEAASKEPTTIELPHLENLLQEIAQNEKDSQQIDVKQESSHARDLTRAEIEQLVEKLDQMGAEEGVANLVNSVFSAVLFVPMKMIDFCIEDIKQDVKVFCSHHPNVCKKSTDLAKQAIRKGTNKIPQPLKAYFNRRIKRLGKSIEKRKNFIKQEIEANRKLGIPDEMTRRYYQNLGELGVNIACSIPIPGAIFAKSLVKGMVNGIKSATKIGKTNVQTFLKNQSLQRRRFAQYPENLPLAANNNSFLNRLIKNSEAKNDNRFSMFPKINYELQRENATAHKVEVKRVARPSRPGPGRDALVTLPYDVFKKNVSDVKSSIKEFLKDESGVIFIPKKIDLSQPGQFHARCYYFSQKQADSKTLNVFVKYLGVTDPNGVFLEYIACSPKKIPLTTGITFKALQALKQEAKKDQLENLFLQWKPLNEDLLKIFYKNKRFEYVGHQKGFIEEEASKSYAVFKMNLSGVKSSVKEFLNDESGSIPLSRIFNYFRDKRRAKQVRAKIEAERIEQLRVEMKKREMREAKRKEQEEIILARKREEKRNETRIEESLLQQLSKEVPSSKANLPKTRLEFYKNCSLLHVNISKFGERKQSMSGDLTYHSIADGVFFLMKVDNSLVREKFGRKGLLPPQPLLKYEKLNKNERLGLQLQAMEKFASEQGCKSLFISWDPKHTHLLSQLGGDRCRKEIVGLGQLKFREKQLPVIEISLKGVTRPSRPGPGRDALVTLPQLYEQLPIKPLSSLYSENIIKKVYASVKGEQWMNLAMKEIDLSSFLPVFKQDHPEIVWKSAVKSLYLSFSKDVTIQNLNRNPFRTIVKMTHQGQSFIIKERQTQDVICELMGLDILHSLELNYLNVPTPIAVGRYLDVGDGSFIVKSHMPGDTLEEIMQKIGSSVIGSEERQVLVNDLTQASYITGKAMAEVQRKGLEKTKPNKLKKEDVDSCIDWLENKIELVETVLPCLGIKDIDIRRPAHKIIKDFKQDPGLPSYGFGDLNASQLTWSSTHRPALGIVDTEMIPRTFKASKQPRKPIYQEYYGFFHSLSIEGVSHGLSLGEVKNLQAAFNRGYTEEFAGTSIASNRFFDFQQSLKAIEYHASSRIEYHASREELVNKQDLLDLIREFKQKWF